MYDIGKERRWQASVSTFLCYCSPLPSRKLSSDVVTATCHPTWLACIDVTPTCTSTHLTVHHRTFPHFIEVGAPHQTKACDCAKILARAHRPPSRLPRGRRWTRGDSLPYLPQPHLIFHSSPAHPAARTLQPSVHPARTARVTTHGRPSLPTPDTSGETQRLGQQHHPPPFSLSPFHPSRHIWLLSLRCSLDCSILQPTPLPPACCFPHALIVIHPS